MNYFDKKSEKLLDIIGVIGVSIIWSTFYFFKEKSGPLFWVLMIAGGILGYFSAYAGLAKKFDLKPFTSDPLGWRATRKSYDKNEKKKEIEKEAEKINSTQP
jgi:hypothetical protein